jgi:FKBP-type peptidyl-prolyl cis-trans isomerase
MALKPVVNAAASLLFAVFLISCSNGSKSGLEIKDIVVGTGDEAVNGAKLSMQYTGWLYTNGQRGKKFDSSLDSGLPYRFKLGAGEVIEGWDRGIEGMRVGGERELIIPPELAYGDAGSPPDIPPNSTLIFDVRLLEISH